MDSSLRQPRSATARRARLGALQLRVLRVIARIVFGGLCLLPLVWVLFLAPTTGKWATSFGSAVHDPKDFLITALNGVTAAGLYFVVASGFTLIFGLMRVVNMAHGAFFLLGGYIALRVQRNLVGEGSVFGLTSSQVSLMNWLLPALAGTAVVAGLGLLMQQAFLRWNQGQDLRQALITIAISIILADQMLAHFGGVAQDIAWPATFDKFVDLRVSGIQYTTTRLVILGIAVGIGGLLWLWLKRTRTGMVIRAGVDDRAMVAALGINIQRTFAIAFVVGSGLAGLGGVIGGSFAGLAPGVDANWLLYSLVVVIIGGMGSLGGAAIGALLLGLTSNFSAAYLPSNYTYYSIIFTFALVAVVLAVRPARPVRAARMRPAVSPDRVVGVVALVFAAIAPRDSVDLLGQRAADAGHVPRHRRGQPDLPLFVRRPGLACPGRAVRNRRFRARQRDHERQHEGPQPRLEPVARRHRRGRDRCFGRVALRGAREPQHRDLLPDDHAHLLGHREPVLRPGDRRSPASEGSAASPRRRSSGSPDAHPNRLYYISFVIAVAVYALLRYIVRTPFGLTLQGLRDDPVRMASLGYNVALHRTVAFGFASFIAAVAGVLFVWWNGSHRPGVDRLDRDDRRAGDRCHRRPLPARGCVARRPVLRDRQQLLAAHRLHRRALPHADRGDLPR